MTICPELKDKKVRDDFNGIVERLGGKALEESHIADRKSYKDGLSKAEKDAYHRTYYYWDKHKGDVAPVHKFLDSVEKIREAIKPKEIKTIEPNVVKPTKKQKVSESWEKLKAHYTPGNEIYNSYWGTVDRVLDFKGVPGDWSVQVQQIKDDRGKPVLGEPRWHSTAPFKGDKVLKEALKPEIQAKQPQEAPKPQPTEEITEKATTTLGSVRLDKGGIKPFTEWREITKGPKKGRITVTLSNGDKETVKREQIRTWPEGKGPEEEKPSFALGRKEPKTIKIYRGQSVYNKGGNYYSTDKEWARQFTQSGRESEITSFIINEDEIYQKYPLPQATNEKDFDNAIKEAKEKGYSAVLFDEGKGQPNSIYVISKEKIDPDSLSNEILNSMNRTLKANGYDVRGTDDIKTLMKKGSVFQNGEFIHEDWQEAYDKAVGTQEKRKGTLAKRSELKNINWQRLKELGKTTNIKEAGYITPDGEYLDFSGKRIGGTPGDRALDHREAGGTDGMQELMAYGYIRMDDNSGSIDIAKEPTPAQYEKIRILSGRHNGYINIDLEDGLGEYNEESHYYREPKRTFSNEYPKGTKPERIITDIKKFFTGEEPVQSLAGNVPVFLTEDTPTFPFKAPPRSILTRDGVERIVNRMKIKLPNIGKVIILKNQDIIPEEVHRRAGLNPEKMRSGKQKIFGYFDPRTDTTYIIADNMKNRDMVESALLHEIIGHRGVFKILPKNERMLIFNQIRLAYANTDIGRKLITDYGLNLNDKDPEKRTRDQTTFSKEFIARMAETGENPSLLDKIITWIRRALRRLGFNIKFSDKELRTLLGKSREYAKRGKGVEARTEEPSYMMAGEKAKGAPVSNISKAQEMIDSGKSDDEVWKATGWTKDPSGKWTFRIDDSGAKLIGVKGKLPDVLDHPDLFKAYPQLKDVKVESPWGGGSKAEASYDTGRKTINAILDYSDGRLDERMLPTILHEVQHAVQNIEGFSPGGNPDFSRLSKFDFQKSKQKFLDEGYSDYMADQAAGEERRRYQKQAKDEAMGGYRRIPGEISARETQKGFTGTPFTMEGIPRDQWVVKDSDKGTSFSVEKPEAQPMFAKEGEVITREDALKNPNIFWHGSPSGELKGGAVGIHIGTYEAAKQALEARIGVPAEGEWDGTREYGKTLLAGKNTLLKIDPKGYNQTGFNVGEDVPKEDYYPKEKAQYSDKSLVSLKAKPSIEPYQITGKMTNSRTSPHEDEKANALMSGQLKKGTAKSGYYYINTGEDEGSISAVVPNSSHLKKVIFAESEESPSFSMEKEPDYKAEAEAWLKEAMGKVEDKTTGKDIGKESKLAIRAEADAIEAKLTEDFGDLVEYKTKPGFMKDQADRAEKIMDEDYEQAKLMAMGEIKPPEGVREATMFESVKIRALNEGDWELLHKLATESTVPRILSEYGQAIKSAHSKTMDDPVVAMQEIEKVRAEKIKKTTGKKPNTKQTEEIARLNKELESTKKALDEYIAREGEKKTKAVIDELIKIKVSQPKETRDVKVTAESLTNKITASLDEGKDLSDISNYIQELAKYFVSTGIKERSALVTAVHNVLKDIIPDITERETMDAISGYGKYKLLDKDEILTQLRDLKGQMQQIAKLEDLQKTGLASKTGIERRTPSDEERRLIKLVEEAKKKYGIEVVDKGKQLKSALDAIKTRLTNQITDLETQIESRQKIVKEKTGVTYDVEANKLKTRRDELKDEFDKIFGKKRISESQRIAIALQAVHKSIADYTRKISEKDLTPMNKRSDLHSTELDKLRGERENLKDQLQELRDLANPKKTPEQIALQSLKTRLRNDTLKLNNKLDTLDFAKKEKRPVKLDPEAERLKAEHEQAKENYNAAVKAVGIVTKEEAANIVRLSQVTAEARTAMEQGADRHIYGAAKVTFENYVNNLKGENLSLKILLINRWKEAKTTWKENKVKTLTDLIKDTIVTISDNSISFLASMDNSFLGRQGLSTLMTHPSVWFPAAGKSMTDIYKSLISKHGGEVVRDAVLADAYSRPNYINGNYVTAKLIPKTEEQFPAILSERLPVIGRMFRASENAFVDSAIRMRINTFDLIQKIAEDQGVDTTDKVWIQDVGTLINAITARGDLGRWGTGGVLRLFLWAPKMLKGNIDVLTAHMGGAGLNTSFARKQAGWNLLKIVLLTGAIVAIANAIKKGSVEINPLSSDFLKIKVGNTRYDITGGKASIITLLARIVTFSTKSSATGITTALNSGKYGAKTLFDVGIDFLVNKTTPLARAGIDIAKGKNFQGQKPTVFNVPYGLTTPISIQNFVQNFYGPDKDGSVAAVVGSIVDIFGINANTYNESKSTFVGEWLKIEKQGGSFDDLKKEVQRYNEIQKKLGDKGQQIPWSKIAQSGIKQSKLEKQTKRPKEEEE